MKKRLLSLVLAVMTVAGIAIPASAGDTAPTKPSRPEPEIIDSSDAYWNSSGNLVVRGKQYVNIGSMSNADGKEPFDYYRDILTSYQLMDANVAEAWLRLGVWLGSNEQYEAPYLPLQKAVYDTDDYIDLMKRDDNEPYMWGDWWFDTYTSGLRYANSIKAANEDMIGFASWAYHKTGGKSDRSFPISNLSNDPKYNETQPVYYMMLYSGKLYYGTGWNGNGAGLGVVFSDFQFRPVFPDQKDDKTAYQMIPNGNPDKAVDLVRTTTVNNTASTLVANQGFTDEVSTTVSSGYTKSHEFSWGSGIEIGNEWGAQFGPASVSQHVNYTMTTSEAISQAWSQETSKTKVFQKESGQAVEMPPYTRVMLESCKTTQDYLTSWNGPLELTFKVTFIDYGMELTKDALPKCRVLNQFPSGDIVGKVEGDKADALSSLLYRYDHRNTFTDINWNPILNRSKNFDYKNRNGSIVTIMDDLKTWTPSIYRMENMHSTFETTYHEANNLTALYPLAKIHAPKTNEIKLSKGSTFYLNDIELEGLNKYDAPFHNFNSEKGSWIVCDDFGNPTTSKLINIVTDSVSGKQKMTAGTGSGTAYIKFLIDEDYYKNPYIYSGDSFSNSTIKNNPIPVIVSQSNFKDVHTYDYFYEPVYWAVNEGITTGLNKTTFGPKEECTREQVATFLWRYAGKPAPQGKNPFRDVYAGHYAFDPIVWAADQGIAKGITPTTFGPKDEVTRAQFVTMLWRLAGQPQPKSMKSPFKDVNANSWFGKAVLWAVENGITTGAGNGKFNPNGLCERAQVVTFLYRYDNIK